MVECILSNDKNICQSVSSCFQYFCQKITSLLRNSKFVIQNFTSNSLKKFNLALCVSILLLLLCSVFHCIIVLQSKPHLKLSYMSKDSGCVVEEDSNISSIRGTNFSRFLKAYISNHAHKRREIVNSPSYEPSMKSAEILVWRCRMTFSHSWITKSQSCGGIGDRMNGIRFALLVAILTNRTFFIDMPPSPFNFMAAVQPAFVDWRIPINIRKRLSKTPKREDWMEPMPFNRPSRFSIENSNVIPRFGDPRRTLLRGIKDKIVTTTNTRTHNHFMNVLENDFIPEIFQTPKQEIARTLSQILFSPSKRTLRGIRQRHLSRSTYVGIHLRTGVDVGEFMNPRFSIYRTVTVKHIAHDLVKCARRYMKNETEPLLLTSDSHRHAKEIAKIGREQNVTVILPRRTAIHIERTAILKRNIAEMCERYMDVFIDMYTLANSRVLIATPSQFSLTASLTGSVKPFIHFQPRNSQNEGFKCLEKT